ncbi:NACHT, LRR and PYD domains-containing protein 3-like [Dendronephthya gigantea]|uniref:NACHT, LRR and PYD domains-containing protein 3-like n=1 Tax=Dendronephthya gigantea TaxID=151771 RepID=UPI00106D78CB|nr:NACHT, LRR and PYD domains-containing protein 3-like [Dendronephthya gigantea]
MLDAVKDYLTPKTFSIPAYVCLIAQLLCGPVLTGIVVALRVGEFAKFNCAVGPESAASYKTTVEKTCYSRYEEKYNSPLPFYGFVILSIWFPIFVAVIYSLSVRNRVEEISGSNDEPQNDAEAGNEVHNRRSFYVFYSYFFHLVIRLLFGLVFTILQYAVFFRSGFDFEFSCDQPASDVTSKIAKNASVSQLNSTTSTITCENSTASEKQLWAGIVCALNTIFAAIIFVEVIHLCLRFPKNLRFWSKDGRVHDTEFITVYFSRKRYAQVNHNPDLDLGLNPNLDRSPVPDSETSSGPNLDRNPVPDSETSSGPNLDRNPVPDSETSSGPNLYRNPVPDSETSSGPNLDGNPVPDSETSSGPNLDRNPVPDSETSSGPNLDRNPVPDSETSSGPNLDRNPVPDSETSSGPNLDRSPVPDSETSSGPNLDRNPVPDSETSSGPNLDRNPVPDSETSSGPNLYRNPVPDSETSSGPNLDGNPFLHSETSSGPNLDRNPVPDSETSSVPNLDRNPVPDSETSSGPNLDRNPVPDSETSSGPNLDRNPVPDSETSSGPYLDRNPVPDSETSSGPNLDRNPVPDSETSSGSNLDRNPVPDPDHNLECINLYKEKVSAQSLSSDITYGPKTGLDDLFIDVVIHTERARHNFPTKMDRHEIFDVYMKVPDDSIRLEKVKDLFYPNKDTEGNRPRKILAVGRPGIGKTVLTEKIMRDWAKQIDEFYSGMIAFHFKFRLFNRPEWHHDNLKNFLRFGTACDEEFERIFDYITKEPEKALLIFDGLDEFDGNIKDCLDQAVRQNSPDICMPAISLFIKLISGHFLPGATILVTTRPTASDYSKLRFDRTVEIIGFTSEKIEHYVIKFCENHNRSYLKPEMWNHINSSSDLLNLCYIPVNSFIVSTVLFKYFTDRSNETAVLPTTLTELYQAAIKHFDKDHYRKTDGPSSKMVVKNLQSLAYKGILHGQLVFNEELFDEEMRRSGLLNKLSNPIHPAIQEQFCFIHLTVQEFLAAKHVTEKQSLEEIKNFICSNVKDGKWHLVLQFIAGILGQKIKTCGEEYQRFKDCVLAFAESFRVDEGELAFGADYVSLFVMKCFREAGDEDIVKEACERTAINVGRLSYDPRHDDNHFLSSSEWAAVIFVCKCIKELKVIEIVAPDWSEECYREFCVLLQQRCIKELVLVRPSMLMGDRIFSYFISLFPGGLLFKALKNLKCTLDHEHSKLTKLNVRGLFTWDENLSMIVEFFEHGHASCLKTLGLGKCRLTLLEIGVICKVLDNKLCPELTCLDLFGNMFRDDGVRVLCNALIKCHHLKLTGLNLHSCLLTEKCIPSLCELFKDEHCKLTHLDIGYNQGISDKGVRMLCEDVLTNEHCKLAELNLGSCSLTDQCIPWLSKALLDKRCVINRLGISQNNFTANGKNSLRELEANQDCKARGLVIYCRDPDVIFSINMSGTD